jgi:hypothetical protein
VLNEIKALRAEGHTLQSIANRLNENGVPRREGGEWEHTFLSRLLRKSA